MLIRGYLSRATVGRQEPRSNDGDRRWLRLGSGARRALSEGYCITLVRGLSAAEFLSRLAARPALEDGIIRLNFEPLLPWDRQGSTPDALVADVLEVGFDLSDDGDNVGHNTASAFALAERLTGVRITPSLLGKATYQCGIVKMPD